MKIAIGCDHGGFELKNEIRDHLKDRGFEVEDFGITELKKVDYPEIAVKVAHAVADGKCDRGITRLRYRNRYVHRCQQG